MMDKIIRFIKKYKIAILLCLSILVVGFFIGFIVLNRFNSIKIKEYSNDIYSINYDTSWKIKEKNDESIKLVHNKNGEINIQIVSLEEEYKYSSSDDILEELLFNIEKQNESYKLLIKEKTSVTKYKYDGYKILYENNENQVLVVMGKKTDKLLLITYEAKNEYFDILLDSVQNIIYDFQILDESFDLAYNLEVETKDIGWSTNNEIKDANNVNEYEIAAKNYLVKYSVPKNFELSSFDSMSSYFDYRGLSNGSIALSVHISNSNIYEYIDKDDKYSSLYYPYTNQREGKDGYSDFRESLQKLENEKYLNYIYKNSYKLTGTWLNNNYEEVILLYELDSNHILTIKITATDTKISKDLVDNIKVIDSKNYASYIKKNIVDGYLIGNLKQYTDYKKDSVREITLKLPTKYIEIDRGYNIYSTRIYGLDYNSNDFIYKYDVKYDLNNSVESKVKTLNSSNSSIYKNNGNYQELIYTQDITLNEKLFKVYTGGYTDKTETLPSRPDARYYYVNSKVLFYEFDDGKCLSIEIKGNGVEVSYDILNELTNFDVEIKKVKKES